MQATFKGIEYLQLQYMHKIDFRSNQSDLRHLSILLINKLYFKIILKQDSWLVQRKRSVHHKWYLVGLKNHIIYILHQPIIARDDLNRLIMNRCAILLQKGIISATAGSPLFKLRKSLNQLIIKKLFLKDVSYLVKLLKIFYNNI